MWNEYGLTSVTRKPMRGGIMAFNKPSTMDMPIPASEDRPEKGVWPDSPVETHKALLLHAHGSL